MTIRTMATPEQIAAFRAARDKVSQHFERPPATRGKPKPKPRLVPATAFTAFGGIVIQVPLKIVSPNRWRNHHETTRIKHEQKCMAAAALCSIPEPDRSRIDGFLLTHLRPDRKHMDDDNLEGAFKAMRDVAFFWMKHGSKETLSRISHSKKGGWHFDAKDIGNYDAVVESGEMTCQYTQNEYATDPRYYGIRISLLLRPS